MVTAIDSSVLLDVICDDQKFADASEDALREASKKGSLILCECVLAEIQPALSGEKIPEFLKDWNLRFIPSSEESALLAGKHLTKYLERGGKSKRVLPDFLIGAHALVNADQLLARDRGYLRDYFKNLRVVEP